MLEIKDEEFVLISSFIKEKSGINISSGKKTLLEGRLSSLIISSGFKDFMSYYNFLKKSHNIDDLISLVNKISTNHTYFLREPEHFDYFNKDVLPFLKANVKNKDIRIWCAASSTGEEAYVLAMILSDFFKNEENLWDKKLLATDISLNALNKAKLGIYKKEEVAKIPRIWIQNYFKKAKNGDFEIIEALKKQVIFRQFNLTEKYFPFKKKMHVVFLRNVMIYFDEKTKDELVEKIYQNMEYGGYLFIGHSESINKEKTKFKFIKPAIYRKM